jgi:excisionase family DNA binding protein
VSVTVTLLIGTQALEVELDDTALATIAAALPHSVAAPSPYVTVLEAAELLRTNRQRIYDLLSARKLERLKDGSRTLLRRADVLAYLENGDNRRWTR